MANRQPGAPASITLPSAIYEETPFTVRWGASEDADGNLAGYELYTSWDGGTNWGFTKKTDAFTTTHTFTVPAGRSTVRFKVMAYDTDGEYSDETISENRTVTVNAAPSDPSSITVPSSISGGSTITVSWGASTDSNLEGYILERSVDGGTTWTRIYQGSSRSTTNTVPTTAASVIYRVKAYDTLGKESEGYRTSSPVDITNNSAPNIPAAISVPSTLYAGLQINVSWTAATPPDPDGDAVTYELQRSTNSGSSWSDVYSGSNLAFVEVADASWTKVRYRVRAVDPYSEHSNWKSSTDREIKKNSLPTLTADKTPGDQGTISSGFTIHYSVDDSDAGDTLTVEEMVRDRRSHYYTTYKTFTATRNTQYTFNFKDGNGNSYWQRLLNGEIDIQLRVYDGTAYHTAHFAGTKNQTGASIKLSTPKVAADTSKKIDVCFLSFEGSIPTGGTVTVEVTNNASDTTPVWEDCTAEVLAGSPYTFTNATAANGFAFNFRITAQRGTGGTVGGWISSVQGVFSTVE